MRTQIKCYAKYIPIGFLLLFTGCANHAVLKRDQTQFGYAYTDARNKQLLENLARLANHDPISFIQLGSFSSQYQFGTGVAFSPSYVNNSPSFYNSAASTTTGSTPPTGASSVSTSIGTFMKNVLTLGGSASANVTETPIFQYFPVTGSNAVAATLNPITEKVFNTLYNGNFGADWLARTMVASVKHTIIDTNTVPWKTNLEFLVISPSSPSYPHFLQFCDGLYNAQQYHTLTLDQSSSTNIVYQAAPGTNATLNDVVLALEASQINLTVTYTTNGLISVFQSKQELKLAKNTNILPSDDVGSLTTSNANFMNVSNLANDYGNKYVLNMRTFEATMYGIANEETLYRQQLTNSENKYYILTYNKNTTNEQLNINGNNDFVLTNQDLTDAFGTTNKIPNIMYFHDCNGPYAIVLRTNRLPFQVRPIMRLTLGNNDITFPEKRPENILTSTTYGDGKQKEYFIGDPEGQLQNRTIFTLLTLLYDQTTTSSQNLPVQQLIQVP